MRAKLRHIPYYGSLALLAYMPFHIFLSQWLSTFTGGLEAWKIGKDILTIGLLLLSVGLVLADKKLRQNRVYLTLLGLTIAYGVIHGAMYVLNKDTTFDIARLASAYNNRLLWYALIAMASVMLVGAKKGQLQTALKLVIAVSTLVCVLGLLQWFLPKDILTHVGYGVERGVRASFFINEEVRFPRVMSTIRDPNSLGAFLLVPIFMLVQLWTDKQQRRKMLVGGLLLLHGLILLLTFSRAAWGGAIIGLGGLFFMSHREKILPTAKRYWSLLVGAIVVICFVGYSLRDTQFVRSVVFRIDDKNAANSLDSDAYHVYFIQEGLDSVAKKPLGYGPGTAGIVSIQNKNGSFLTENYYLQLAHEVGIVGLLIFATAWGYVVKQLVKRRSVMGIALVASAGAYAIMALVMHLWVNEAVAAQWWLLAGLIVGSSKNKATESVKIG